MKKRIHEPPDGSELRRRAEERLRAKKTHESPLPRNPEETERLLHELQVHRIELEMQNEELLRAHQELEQSSARYLDLYDFSPAGYLTLDESGRILEANLSVCHQLGLERSRVVGASFHRFVAPADRDVLRRHLDQVLETEEPRSCEVRLLAAGGGELHAMLRSIPVPHSDGNSATRTSVTDISERKRMEADRAHLEARNRQLQKAESLGRMAGAIAHHFNNMLTAVLGNLELALDDLAQGSDVRARIVNSMKASHQAAEISRLMLSYLGHTTGRKEPLELAQALRETLPLLGASVLGGVHLKTEIPPVGPTILADGVHVKQVLTSLFSNAVEAMGGNHGGVTVALHVTAAADIRGLRFYPLDWQPKATRYACLSVADTGCGMDAATVEKIFDPFFSTKFTGRGLGLPVVLGLVRAHEGAITVESQVDSGTTFRVFLPLYTQTPPPLEEAPSPSDSIDSEGMVLLVEDEPMVSNMALTLLKRKFGYKVLTAGDGSEAVEIFRVRKEEISLVLLDLSMPGMNGWETLSALRALRPDIPVVLTSGYDEAQVMQGDHPERPQAFLHKPYLAADLKAALSAARRRASAEDSGDS